MGEALVHGVDPPFPRNPTPLDGADDACPPSWTWTCSTVTLLALAAVALQRLDLRRKGPKQLHREIRRYCPVAGSSRPLQPAKQMHRRKISRYHLRRQHALDLVAALRHSDGAAPTAANCLCCASASPSSHSAFITWHDTIVLKSSLHEPPSALSFTSSAPGCEI